MLDSRIIHLIKKEFLQLKRDPRMMYLAILAPIIQLLVFGYIATTDIKNVTTNLIDNDKTYISRGYVTPLINTGYFDLKYNSEQLSDAAKYLDSGKAKLALYFPPGFSSKVLSGRGAEVLAVVDGTDSNMATIVIGYLSQINMEYNQKIIKNKLRRAGLSPEIINPVNFKIRVWYNPDLKSVNFMVPAIIALLLMMESMVLTSFAIVKEKTRGTLEQLIVTPLKSYELILGKIIPFVLISMIDVVLITLIGTIWFGVPLKGSFFLLFILSFVYLFSTIGLGALISTTSQNERQALLSSIFIIIPSIILSGFMFPIANMPKWIQFITYAIPVRYFLTIVRSIFLKGIGINYLWKEAFPLIIIGSIIFAISFIRFKKKVG